ncbi:hypothetical protein EV175_003675 [Coemansia sp. RSA 1933]|nr:hypothetical protein EV175_003675 [Coemansia sp. RSA 1933]
MQSKRRKIEHLPETAECQYDWSASDSMSNLSFHSPITNSSYKSILSMPSPSSDQSAPPSFNHSSNEEMLAENFSLDIDAFPNVGSRKWYDQTVNIYQPNSPTHRVRKRISPEEEYLHSVSDSALATSGGTRIEDIQSMDVETKCRIKREYLFEGSLLQTMHPQFYREHFIKHPDNSHLLCGLLFGVFEIPPTELGSKANNIEDIRMVPCEESDIQGNILSASHPHSGSGLDVLTDSFWFNTNEVELMLDNSAQKCPRIVGHKPVILKTIRDCDWYNGYYIGRFRGKYNPWSVSSFIECLCNLLNQTSSNKAEDIKRIVKAAAKAYWVTTGTTGLIEAQIDRHRMQFIHLAKRLLRNYEITKVKRRNGRHSRLRESSYGVLSNHEYKGKDYANHVANTIMTASRFGVLTHPKQKSVKVSHVIPMREDHAGVGRCDYTMRLYSTNNQPNQFGVIVEFKLIPVANREDVAVHKELVEQALTQITTNNYDSCLLGCLERMDVGMATGNSVIYTVSKLYKRKHADEPWRHVFSLVKERRH